MAKEPAEQKQETFEVDPELENIEFDLEELDGDDTPAAKEQPDEEAKGLREGQEEGSVDSDDEPDEEGGSDDEERRHFGRRAEARIKGLVRDKKNLEERLAALEAERNQFQQERQKFERVSKDNEQHAIAQHEARLEAEERRLEADWQEAHMSDDRKKLWDIQTQLARVEAEKLALDTYKRQNARAPEAEEEEEKAAPKSRQPSPPVPQLDPQQQRWWRENRGWFDQRSPQYDYEMRSLAEDIHLELVNDGFDPAEAPLDGESYNEYYNEMNRRLRKHNPEKFGANKKVQPVVAGKSRTPGTRKGGATVKLSASELERAKNLGVDPKSYAREKARLQRMRG